MASEDNKIVLITNRGVRPSRRGASLFKNSLTTSPHTLRCAEVETGSRTNRYSLTLIDQGQEQAFLDAAVAGSNDRPWVFFVHGNNQTLDKNLAKCFGLRNLYDVNVMAFSWPSVHHGKLRGVLNYLPRQVNIGKYLTRQLTSKLKQYRKARKNARQSAPHLSAALTMAKQAFTGAGADANFVCHSLGHYVLQKSHDHQSLADTLSPFSKVLLHQGDADDKDHRAWTDAINKGSAVVITTNENDKVLELSNMYNHRTMKNRRLGNVAKRTLNGSPTYRDFSDAEKIGFSGHSIFLTPASKNPEVHAYFRALIGNS